MESLESQRQRELKAKKMWAEEELTNAWYVTLAPHSQFARAFARRRNLKRLGLDPNAEFEVTILDDGRVQYRTLKS
jgi:hypothetical protein